MHERERRRRILQEVADRRLATVAQLTALLGVSDATIRRDIGRLASENLLRKVRGGAESLEPEQHAPLLGSPFRVSAELHVEQKRAVARRAVAMCVDGEAIIVNGGTTTFAMVEFLRTRRLQILTNSIAIVQALLTGNGNQILVPGGEIYREQAIILSPFENDVIANFYGTKLFLSGQGIGPHGLTEADPLLIQAEQKLIGQADQIVVLADSSKFRRRGSLILCPLSRIDTIITDSNIDDQAAKMVEEAGVELVVVDVP